MTYAEYSKQLSAYNKAISAKKSLSMVVRMNHAHLTNKESKRGLKRLAAIAEAEKQLSALIVPPKPQQPIGYQVFVNDDFQGFVASDDLKAVRIEAEGFLGHTNYTLKAKPRWRD